MVILMAISSSLWRRPWRSSLGAAALLAPMEAWLHKAHSPAGRLLPSTGGWPRAVVKTPDPGARDARPHEGRQSSSASSITASVLELLSAPRAGFSAHSPRLAAGASTLSPADLSVLRAHVLNLNTLLAQARDSMTTQQKPLPPPSGEVRGSALFPHLDKLAANPNIESLAGDDVEPPILMPVRSRAVPTSRKLFRSVQRASEGGDHLHLLANQRGLVADSYALRFSLLSHLFLRVLPLPLPIGREDRKIRCFWARKRRDITHDTQAEILRWLSLLARHFAAASLSIPLAPTADATRIFVFAAITAIADAVLRRTACDVPSALSLHYSGEAEGPAGPFALEMRHFEVESERAQLPSPHLAAARTMLLDYFRSASAAVPSDRHVFRYERSMELGSGRAHPIIPNPLLSIGLPTRGVQPCCCCVPLW